MTRVLVTGAAGKIGRILHEGLAVRYELLRLADILPVQESGAGEEAVIADVRNLADCERIMEGVDCVVHLAGTPDEADWEKIRDLNINGTYNVFEAARRCKVGRVVFASSNMAIGFYRREQVLDTKVLPRPSGLYGVSKACGEALGRLYADKHGMSVACVRIGSFRERPQDERHLATWISHRDFVHLIARCIEAPSYHYEIVYGVSANTRNMWVNDAANRLGYKPIDNSETYAEEILANKTIDVKVAKVLAREPRAAEVIQAFQGGYYCAMNFNGDLSLID